MRFFRGIAVAATEAENTIATIRSKGLVAGQGISMSHERPYDITALHLKRALSTRDTRPGTQSVPAVCACGDKSGGVYYACSHNLTPTNDTPLLIEFDAEMSAVAVNGSDFLYTIFQLGDRQLALSVLYHSFGDAVLRYADQAWTSEFLWQWHRIAQCDLAIHDPGVIQAHHANEVVLAGRDNAIFRSAFTIELPVKPEFIVNVSSLSPNQVFPQPEECLMDLLLQGPH